MVFLYLKFQKKIKKRKEKKVVFLKLNTKDTKPNSKAQKKAQQPKPNRASSSACQVSSCELSSEPDTCRSPIRQPHPMKSRRPTSSIKPSPVSSQHHSTEPLEDDTCPCTRPLAARHLPTRTRRPTRQTHLAHAPASSQCCPPRACDVMAESSFM